MDESLQQIFRLRPLQENLIAYRNGNGQYRKILKETYRSEMQNLVDVKLCLDVPNIKFPESSDIPVISEFPPPMLDAVTDLLCDYENTLNYIKSSQ